MSLDTVETYGDFSPKKRRPSDVSTPAWNAIDLSALHARLHERLATRRVEQREVLWRSMVQAGKEHALQRHKGNDPEDVLKRLLLQWGNIEAVLRWSHKELEAYCDEANDILPVKKPLPSHHSPITV
jgi:hypothetical protein